MSNREKPVYSFGRFRLDANKGLLLAGDEVVTLTPKAFDTLLVLVENRKRVLGKEELMRLVWADQIVEENNLAQNIHVIRKSLGDGVAGARYIETIPKRGYRFVADVEVSNDPVPDKSEPAPDDKPREPVKPKTQYAVSTGDVNIAYQVIGDGLLERYLRRELALFRGKEVEMTADHLLATFDGPARAIHCAHAIIAVAARLDLRVRAGLHTGECDVAGETISGVAVDLSKSVARLAPPGEVLISQTVKDLVAGSGIEFEPRIAQAFQNLSGEWRLFAVGSDK
ncbi:MAG: winged helix-turn-helix domain-containing protein [Blastocatellia bacterium]